MTDQAPNTKDIPTIRPGTDLMFNCPNCEGWGSLEFVADNTDQHRKAGQLAAKPIVVWWRAYRCSKCLQHFVQYCDVIKITAGLFADLMAGERIQIDRVLETKKQRSERARL